MVGVCAAIAGHGVWWCGSVQVLQAAEQFGGIVAGDQGLQRGRQL